MKTVEIKLYSFEELSDEAKEKAINDKISSDYFDAEWLIDDCGLFYINGRDIVENSRKNIFFSIGREWYLDCADAMVINDEKEFLIRFGCPEWFIEKVYFTIRTPYGRYSSTIIDIEENEVGYSFTDEELEIVENIEDSFNGYIDNVLTNIKEDYEYMLSDEYIEELLTDEGEVFTEEGNIHF